MMTTKEPESPASGNRTWHSRAAATAAIAAKRANCAIAAPASSAPPKKAIDTDPISNAPGACCQPVKYQRSEEHTSELQSLMRISYAVFCLKKTNKKNKNIKTKRNNISPVTSIKTYMQKM